MDRNSGIVVAGALAVIGVGSLLFYLNSTSKKEISEKVPDEVPEETPAPAEESPAPADSEPTTTPAEAVLSEEDQAAAEKAEKETEYKKCVSISIKYIKASEYQKSIKASTQAIELADELGKDDSVIETLYNNRSAAYEKAKMFKESLTDCTYVLTINPKHTKVRKRRARMYVEQDRVEEALIEMFVIILAGREEFKKKMAEIQAMYGHNPILMEAQMQQHQPEQPENLEEVMQKVGSNDVEILWNARDESKLKGRMASRVAIGQLLLGYRDYLEIEKDMRFKKVGDLTAAVETAEGAEKPLALQDLAFWYMTQRQYSEAKDTLNKAYEACTGSGLEGPKLAKLVSWVGVFEHMCYQMDSAKIHYDQAREADPDSIEILVKQAGVCLDLSDLEGAEALYKEAESRDPNSTDLLYHRAQLWVMKKDMEKAEKDLRACIAKEPSHTIAIVKLACLLMNGGSTTDEVESLVDQAQIQRPNMSEIYQVKGELSLSTQPPKFEEALAHFDSAIERDDTNALARVYKALTLYQMSMVQTQVMDPTVAIPQLEKAIEVDPTCIRTYIHLAELKLQAIKNLEEGQDVIQMLNDASHYCNDKAELLELTMLRGVARAQLEAASQLGLTTLS